jgi:hypothetical protein
MPPVSPADIDSFFRNGFVILRDAISTPLLRDLRRECDKGLASVRTENRANRVGAAGLEAQRFQPVSKYADVLDLQPFKDYAELPALSAAFKQILGPDVFYGKPDVIGVFVEPEHFPWSFGWHRDLTLESSRLGSQEAFDRFALDWDSLNQINCALYNDDCTWYVPGSHLRTHDTPAELAAAAGPNRDAIKRLTAERDTVALERLHLDQVRSMSGAVQVHLNAGDLLLYRAIGWHNGNYVPYRKRATILDVLYSPAYREWRHPWLAGGSPKWKPAKPG